jgi:sugar phosphate isomerase/epimerase
MTRREILALAGSAPAWLSAVSPLAEAQQGKTKLGAARAAFNVRQQAEGRVWGSSPMVEHCHAIGLGGAQTTLEGIELEPARQLRQKVEGYGMQLILNVPTLPSGEDQAFKFGVAVQACKEAGAYCLHAETSMVRWEHYDSLDAFRKDFQRVQNAVAIAEPVLRKYRLKLAIENHKDWRAAEQAAWLKRLDSEWVGVCLDLANNVTLCEEPMETVNMLAPYTMMCHIKDVAVDTYEDGFLLSEVVMGEGMLDLKEIVRILRKQDANMPFYLEMVTRDPWKIPVFTDKYWASFDNTYSPLPGRDLARTLNLVRKNPPKKPLPRVTGLSPEAAVKFEDDNNLKCIEYARQVLNI